MMNDHVVGAANLSEAWARAFLRVARTKRRELGPLVVTVNTALGLRERLDVRSLLANTLAECDETPIDTVASTIFPKALWDPTRPRADLFRRYEAIWPRVARVQQNRRGTYFRRFTAFGLGGLNQIETVLAAYEEGKQHRRSALQLAVLDPVVDHVRLVRPGFPCLHQVAIVPGKDGSLSLTGFYATQTMFEKAYGNYLGLANLGVFLASELRMPLAGITCIASVGLLGQNPKFKEKREAFCERLAALVPDDT
jgi:hypothetical protein